VLFALQSAKGPISPPEIRERAAARVKGIGLATIYRTLKLLVDAQQVGVVNIAGAPPHFEIARAHHHHFWCEACERVFELEGCCGHFTEMTPPGFELSRHEVTLFGRCEACLRAPKGKDVEARARGQTRRTGNA
jgi:Fur family ferric uptake transcriptional regulator